MPLGANYINGRVGGKPVGWVGLLAGGELCLIAAALAADAVGRACMGGARFQGLRIAAGVFCGISLVVTSMYFATVAFGIEEHGNALATSIQAKNLEDASRLLASSGVDRANVAHDSIWFFIIVLICAFCVIIVEEDA
jgi:hypothetical protein